ncbi:hypothetical protein SHO565_62120 [Streptomyces sp. HO565]
MLGPGGIGGLLAALLSRAGHQVTCIAGEETADTLRRGGIRVRSGRFGDFTTAVEADTALREPVDLCLVTVKQTALDAALDRVPPRLLADGLVLPLLNGVERSRRPGRRRRERAVRACRSSRSYGRGDRTGVGRPGVGSSGAGTGVSRWGGRRSGRRGARCAGPLPWWLRAAPGRPWC